MTDKKFELTKDLEGLVGNCLASSGAYELAREKPSTDDVSTREQIFKITHDSRHLNQDPAGLVGDLRTFKRMQYKGLDAKLDDKTYKAGMGFYTGALEPRTKAQMYAGLMIDEGVLPEKPSDGLKKVFGQLKIAEAIEKDLSKGDVKSARIKAQRYFDEDTAERIMYNDLQAGAAYERFLENAVADIAHAQREQAYAALEKGDLYKELDGAIGTAKYGKAKAFTAAYAAYGLQQQINEEKKKAAEAEKAAKAKEAVGKAKK